MSIWQMRNNELGNEFMETAVKIESLKSVEANEQKKLTAIEQELYSQQDVLK
jgi:hypothetical protein